MKIWFVSTRKNQNIYLFLVVLSPPTKWLDDGKDHKFLSCFKKSSIKRFYFTSLHLQTLTTTLQIQQKPLLMSPSLVLHTVENSSCPSPAVSTSFSCMDINLCVH